MFDERSLRDARFVAKCREVGLSLKTIGEVLPSYRIGKLDKSGPSPWPICGKYSQ